MISNLAPRHIFWIFLLLIWSIVLCFINLFNLLSFEFALACTVPLSFCGAHLGLKLQKESESLIFRNTSIWQLWFKTGQHVTVLSILPLLPISINALWIKNCNWGEGFLFYGLLSLCSGWIGAGWGLLLGGMRRGMGSFLFFFVCVLLYGVGSFIFTPAVDVFSTFIGYYPGAIYDEQILIGTRLMCSRLEDFAWIFFGLSLYNLIDDPFLFRRRLITCLTFVFLGATYLQGFALDLHRSTAHIQARLGGLHKTSHFYIHYPQAWKKEKVQALALEVEFAYQELKSELQRDVSQPIHAYFYSNTTMKKRLMGAGRTLIAKPWQYSLHIHQPHVGDESILHELAHVFSAEIANGPHHLSLYKGWIPHMSLIEGFAVAMTWAQNRLDPHQWSAALSQLNLAPSMKSILSPQGFYARNSRLSYTLCGSFVRFYREQKGSEALDLLYREGELIGGESTLEDLIEQWSLYLKNIPLSSQAKSYAKHYLNQPSIFYKVCAHEIAKLKNEAYQLSGQGKWSQVLDKWNQILKYSPHNPNALIKKGNVLYMLGQTVKLKEWIQEQIKNTQLSPLIKNKFQEWDLDLKALSLFTSLQDQEEELSDQVKLQFSQLQQEYQNLLDASFQRPILRRLAVKIDALSYQNAGKWILKVLLHPTLKKETGQLMDWIDESIKLNPNWSIPYYLKGRFLMFQKNFSEGLALLDQSLMLQLPHSSLIYEVERMKAQHFFNQHDYLKAKLVYTQLLERKDLDLEQGEQFVLKRWIRRSAFFNQYVSSVGSSIDSSVKLKAK